MGIGPLIAWRRTSRARALTDAALADRRRARRRRACCVALGAGSSRPGLIAYTFSAFVLDDDRRRARARHARDRLAVRAGRAQPAPLRRLHRPRRRSCCSRSASPARARTQLDVERQLDAGPVACTVAGNTFTYRGVEQRQSVERERDARGARHQRPQRTGRSRTGDQQLLQRRHVARGRDPHELAARARTST